MELYKTGAEVPKDISCVYYAVAWSVDRGKLVAPIDRFWCKIGMSSNPFNRNKTLKYTHIIHCFNLGEYGLTTEKQREFVERYIQAKIEKHRIAAPDVMGGDHFSFLSMSTHEFILEHFDGWALEAIKIYKKL